MDGTYIFLRILKPPMVVPPVVVVRRKIKLWEETPGSWEGLLESVG
jgi:hypothetical protein